MTNWKADCAELLHNHLPRGILPIMAPDTQAAISKADVGASSAPRRARLGRWPLFWTVFGALAASLALWIAIIFVFGLAADLASGILSNR